MDEQNFLAERFEANRAHLRAVAYRMLGSLSEADDAVQEAWLRLSRSDSGSVRNLGGWLTCLRGTAAHQYSAWLFMYSEALRAVPPRDRAATSARLQAGPRDDLRAIRERVERHVNPRLSSAGWHVYDSYLRANRIEAGAASYEDVVRLVLGLRVARDALGRP